MKRKLFPTLRGPMSSVMCRMQDDILDHVDKMAHKNERSRSDMLRILVNESLRAHGIVASVDEMAEAYDRSAA